MRIAVEGCAHGELEKIYSTIQEVEKRDGKKVDLLLCCGDFQSTRNLADLKCMAVPDKYKDICSFYKYYSATQDTIAPVLTIFIGGNHEASNFLQELPYGGWVAPNVYYLGYAGVVNVNGVRIGGLSGIYKGHDYLKGRFEKPPYDRSTQRSVYHIRNLDVFRLNQLKKNPPDIFMSHDWPRGIHKYGDLESLLRTKPFFKEDIDKNALGSRPAEEILTTLRPQYWFSAHLHVKFSALVRHQHEKGQEQKVTRFLALDKCLPRRKFLQVLEIGPPIENTVKLSYDKEWLSVLKSTNHLLSTDISCNYMPGKGTQTRWNFEPTEEELNDISKQFEGNFDVPSNFEVTAAPYDPHQDSIRNLGRTPNPHPRTNKQTDIFCEKLDIDDPIKIILGEKKKINRDKELNVISISSFTCEAIGDELQNNVTMYEIESKEVSFNKDEIMLDEEDSDENSSPENIEQSPEKSNLSSLELDGSLAKKVKLQLPEPKIENNDLTVDMQPTNPVTSSVESFESLKGLVTEENIANSLDSETNEPKMSEGIGSIKKLKRRNVAIYEENDDE